MNIGTQNCQPDLLELFLSGDLDRTQELQLADHLESCDVCRRSLESSAAEPESWTEAGRLLKPTPFDWNPDAEPDNLLNPIPHQIRNVLDSLAPSDDPEMLGQLGGYEVSGVVGAGAMGVVLKASDKSLDRTVAIKVLSPHLATSGAARKRFAREAKAAAAVLHANVIAIHGVSNDQSMPHLVMPYVRGTSLQKRINDDGSLPVNEVLRIGAQIAAGLAAAHAQGLVHRDIKPANILLEEGVERVAITDFGLARAVDDASLTRTGIIAGTPQYMSPEQSRGESVDQRSDLFSLGSVMYAMCVGRPPFRSETTYGVIQRINNDQPTSIRELNPDVPDWLEGLIAKLMSKDASDRFQSAQQVTDLLEGCLAHVQQPSTVPLPEDVVALAKPARRENGKFWRTALATLTVAACFGGLAMLLWGGSDPQDISGKWVGDQWGNVELKQTGPGVYQGSYADDEGKQAGTIELKWSRFEGCFNGRWTIGDAAIGELSLRLVEETIQGASTNASTSRAPGTRRLAEFQWRRPLVAAGGGTQASDAVVVALKALLFDYAHMAERKNWQAALECITDDCRDELILERLYEIKVGGTILGSSSIAGGHDHLFWKTFLEKQTREFPTIAKLLNGERASLDKLEPLFIKMAGSDPKERRRARIEVVRQTCGKDNDRLFIALSDFDGTRRLPASQLDTKLVDVKVDYGFTAAHEAFATVVSTDGRTPISFKMEGGTWKIDNMNPNSPFEYAIAEAAKARTEAPPDLPAPVSVASTDHESNGEHAKALQDVIRNYRSMVDRRNWKGALELITENCRDEIILDETAILEMGAMNELQGSSSKPSLFEVIKNAQQVSDQCMELIGELLESQKLPDMHNEAELFDDLRSPDPDIRREARIELCRGNFGSDNDLLDQVFVLLSDSIATMTKPLLRSGARLHGVEIVDDKMFARLKGETNHSGEPSMFINLIDFVATRTKSDSPSEQKLHDVVVREGVAFAFLKDDTHDDREPVIFVKENGSWKLESLISRSIFVRLFGDYNLDLVERKKNSAFDVDSTKPGRMILHVCDAEGKPLRPLIANAELRSLLDRQGTPDVSADGKRVAFDAWSTVDPRWETGQIVVCDIDGSDAHVICDGFMPSFSPNGKRMAISRMQKYTKADDVQGQSIWIVNTDGSMKRLVADRGAWGARWSSDGKSLVFFGGVDEDGEKVPNNCLRLYDIQTKKITNVFSPNDSPFKKLGFHFEWAKNQRSVAFSGIKRGKTKYVSATIDVDKGLDSLRLFDSPVVYHRLCYDYHPDGQSLLVTGNNGGRTVPVSLALTDERTTRILSNLPVNVRVRDTCYTPDGDHIIAALGFFGPAFPPENTHSRQQMLRGTGKVIALRSEESGQTVCAPTKGVVTKIADGLAEGGQVKKGETLLQIEPLTGEMDRQTEVREAQLATLKAKEQTAKAEFEAYGQSVAGFAEAMEFAIAAAKAKVSSAKEKLHSKQSQVAAFRAKERQAKLNYQRQESIRKKGLTSQDKVEKSKKEWDVAVADYESVQRDVSSLEHELIAKENEVNEKKSVGQTKMVQAIAMQQIAQGQIASARKEISDLLTEQQELKRLVILAPQDGIVLRLNVNAPGVVVKEGDPLLTVVPEATRKAVELFVDGNEIPLVRKGQIVRLEFEGWPSVSGDGFLGTVASVDATANDKGQFRILVTPNENDGAEEWPADQYLRPGVRANGWVLGPFDKRIKLEIQQRDRGEPAPIKSKVESSQVPQVPRSASSKRLKTTDRLKAIGIAEHNRTADLDVDPDKPRLQQMQPVNYVGVCVRADDERPIADAMVRLFLYRKSDSEFVLAKIATSDEQGRFSIRGSVSTEFDLTASRVAISSSGRATSVLTYQATGEATPTIKLVVPSSITGHVTDSNDKPVDGATVILGHLPGVWQARTDADGRFEIADVPAAEDLNFGMPNIVMAVHPDLEQLATTTIKSVPTNVNLQLTDIPQVPSSLAQTAKDALTIERDAPAVIAAPAENLFFDK